MMLTIERSARSLLSRKEGRPGGCCWYFLRKRFERIEDIHPIQREILKIEGMEVLLMSTLVEDGDFIF
jgi:hypothetical protein